MISIARATNRATTLSPERGHELKVGAYHRRRFGRPWPLLTASRVQRQDGSKSKSAEWTQLARGTLNRYLLILKRLTFESSVRAGSPSFVAAPNGPEIRP
jgi:hypothetical protein